MENGRAHPFGRGPCATQPVITYLTKPATLSVAVLVFAALAGASDNDPGQGREGIWKSTPVPKNPNAQFHKQDPFGLANKDHIHTNCSIYWAYPNDGNLYCFNSGTSKAFFIAKPDYYIKKAKAFLHSEESDENPRRKPTRDQ